jgi:hypothetical protein
MLATRIVQLKPFDPESKGVVERMNQYLETSFLPGRSFSSPADFNRQLTAWLPKANSRTVRRLGGTPADLIVQDRLAMLPLPPLAPVVGFAARVRLPRDYYVRVASNDYSVDPTAIGRMVDVTADLTQVTVKMDERIIASHDRHWATGQTITDPAHVARHKCCAAHSNTRPTRRTTSCGGTWPITTPRSVSTSVTPPTMRDRWRDGQPDNQRDRIPGPSVESTTHP